MLQIVLEAAGTVCDADCSIFSQTVDRQPPPQQLIEVWHVRCRAEAASLAAAEKCVYARLDNTASALNSSSSSSSRPI